MESLVPEEALGEEGARGNSCRDNGYFLGAASKILYKLAWEETPVLASFPGSTPSDNSWGEATPVLF